MTDFLKNNDDPKQWHQTADYLKDLLNAEDSAAKRASLNQITKLGWNTNRWVYTLAKQDTDSLISICAEKTLNWQLVFNAKACFGPIDELEKVYKAGRELNFAFNLNEALGFASRSTGFCAAGALKSPGCLETTEQLFKWGADPAHEPHNFFLRAVDECGVEMGKLYARYGLSANHITPQMVWAENNGKPLLHKKIREVYWEYGRYSATDTDTLVETKLFDENRNKLKIVFNFSAERVSEIYEWPGTVYPPMLRDFAFEDYNEAALDKARAKLIELGGRPPDSLQPLEGKKVTVKSIRNGLSK